MLRFHILTALVLSILTLTNCGDSEETAPEASFEQSSVEKSDSCLITCPHCQYSKMELLPTEVCQIKYTCSNCDKVITPKDGDCCVFCSYGSHKCPSMQIEE